MLRRSCVCLCVGVLGAVAALGQSNALPSTKNGEWPHYTGDLKGTKYSPLDQINAGNFNKLELAWRFKTDNLGARPEYKLEGTPLMIKGELYTTATIPNGHLVLLPNVGHVPFFQVPDIFYRELLKFLKVE
jgi:quinoprotein glucose dehydrogenase